jgi:hypothetical protein
MVHLGYSFLEVHADVLFRHANGPMQVMFQAFIYKDLA